MKLLRDQDYQVSILGQQNVIQNLPVIWPTFSEVQYQGGIPLSVGYKMIKLIAVMRIPFKNEVMRYMVLVGSAMGFAGRVIATACQRRSNGYVPSQPTKHKVGTKNVTRGCTTNERENRCAKLVYRYSILIVHTKTKGPARYVNHDIIARLTIPVCHGKISCVN